MAKPQKQARPAAGNPGAPVENSGSQENAQQNAEALLRADHRKVEQLFKQFEAETDSNRKKELARQACNELVVHSMLEEEIFYRACREKNVADDLLDEAQVEHDSLKLLIADLRQSEPDRPFFDAKVSVLSEYVRHHVRQEEKAITGIFAKAHKAGVEMEPLGQRLQERKQQLMTEVESGEIEVPAPRSIQGAPRASSRNREDTLMAREFDSDDDRGFGPESGRGRFGGRYTREQDEETGGRQFAPAGRSRYAGMGGTRDSYSEEGRGGYSGSGDRGYGRSGAGRGELGSSRDYYGGGTSRGRFGGGDYSGRDDYPRGSSGGSGSFERENDDYRRGMGSQDRGRMAGGRTSRDEDYSSLARRSRFGGGGNDRERQRRDDDFEYMSGSRSGFSRERDEQGRFMSDDDDNGGSRGGRGHGRGGWFGDSEGHSRAAQQRSGGSSSRFDDDDDRGSRGGRSGFSRERDEQGRFMSDDDDNGGSRGGRGHGRGGWFGDSRGHSEAARRGARDRD